MPGNAHGSSCSAHAGGFAMPAPPAGLLPVPAQALLWLKHQWLRPYPRHRSPKVEGIGKLDASVDTNDSGSGRIAAIGKFLQTRRISEKPARSLKRDQGEVKNANPLTMERLCRSPIASEKEIGAQEKVIGSVIVGHDGLLIANTMPEEVDAESMGVWGFRRLYEHRACHQENGT
ncbi:MAG: roadblock/LC7 domain-containing protein [Cyanobacteriota/Melainabacteria group bacterium]